MSTATSFGEFSEEEVAVYLDPSYLIKKAVKVISAADVKVTNADRKKSSSRATRRGQFGADFVEDEDWAEQVKLEKAKKLNDTMGEGSPEVEEAKARSEEIINRIDAVLSGSLYALECLTNLSTSSPSLVARLCHSVVSSLMALARSPLVSTPAVDCLYSLVFNLLDDSMRYCKRYEPGSTA